MISTISSQNNPTLKMIRALQKRKYREIQSAFIIEGERIVEEALEQAGEVILILATHSYVAGKDEDWYRWLQGKSIKTYLVSKRIFASISQTENPQGILAVVKKQESSWEKILGLSPEPFLLIIDGIQDPGNLGTILRTAASAGISGALLTKGTVDLYNEKVLRATMGSIFYLLIRQNVDPQEVVDVCSREQLPLVVADPRGAQPYFHWDFTSRMALVIGNESTGPGETLRRAAREVIAIPMPGHVESLNAAVAAGILIFERVRQSS